MTAARMAAVYDAYRLALARESRLRWDAAQQAQDAVRGSCEAQLSAALGAEARRAGAIADALREVPA